MRDQVIARPLSGRPVHDLARHPARALARQLGNVSEVVAQLSHGACAWPVEHPAPTVVVEEAARGPRPVIVITDPKTMAVFLEDPRRSKFSSEIHQVTRWSSCGTQPTLARLGKRT